jgi:hypothetical protein
LREARLPFVLNGVLPEIVKSLAAHYRAADGSRRVQNHGGCAISETPAARKNAWLKFRKGYLFTSNAARYAL